MQAKTISDAGQTGQASQQKFDIQLSSKTLETNSRYVNESASKFMDQQNFNTQVASRSLEQSAASGMSRSATDRDFQKVVLSAYTKGTGSIVDAQA